MSTDAETPGLPGRYIAHLLDVLEGFGVDRDALLGEVRVREIDSPGAQVPLAKVERLLAVAEHATGRGDLGFELGRRLDPTTHDLLGYAMLTSPTLGHVLHLAVTYQRLLQPFFSLSLHRSRGHAELVYVPAVALSHRALRVFEEAIAVTNHVSFARTLGGRLGPYDVHLSIERPGHALRYREIAPARVHFGDLVPGLRIAIPEASLDTPLALANPRAMRAAEERCKSLLRDSASGRRWTDWCSMMLRESEGARPSLEQLAGIVNVSARTLARHLEAEGTGFRDLALRVRTERASRWLAEGRLSVTQVAYRLGYTDVAAFVRAFKDQTGMTPGAARRRATTSPAVRHRARPDAPRASARVSKPGRGR